MKLILLDSYRTAKELIQSRVFKFMCMFKTGESKLSCAGNLESCWSLPIT